jgi:iron(III) transport system ATP-binding protein
MNVLRATLHQQGDRWMMQAEGVGEIPLPAAPKATDGRAMAAGFRPHALHLAAVPNPQLEGVAWMHGVVERSEFLGEFTRYDIRVGSQLVTVDQPHHAGMRLQDAGTALAVGLPTSQIRWLPLIE